MRRDGLITMTLVILVALESSRGGNHRRCCTRVFNHYRASAVHRDRWRNYLN